MTAFGELWTKYNRAFNELHEKTNEYLLQVGRKQELIPQTKLNDMLTQFEAATKKAIPIGMKSVFTSFQKQCWRNLHTIDDMWKDFKRYTTEVRDQV